MLMNMRDTLGCRISNVGSVQSQIDKIRSKHLGHHTGEVAIQSGDVEKSLSKLSSSYSSGMIDKGTPLYQIHMHL